MNTNGTGRIKGKYVESSIQIPSGSRTIMAWHHHAIPEKSSASNRKRHPINQATIDNLHTEITKKGGSVQIIRRREILLDILEFSGARIGEIAEIKVSDIKNALAMEKPMLRLTTHKRKSHERHIPVSKIYLHKMHDYIRNHRQRIIRKSCIIKDSGFLFINDKSARPLTAKYLGDETGMLRREAGIDNAACAYMFRHRFITKLFIAIIEQHRLTNEDEFRRALLDTAAMKQRVMEWTGHKSIKSLDRYIHLAFEEYTKLDTTIDAVEKRMNFAAYNKALNKLLHNLEEKRSLCRNLKLSVNILIIFRAFNF